MTNDFNCNRPSKMGTRLLSTLSSNQLDKIILTKEDILLKINFNNNNLVLDIK